MHRINKKTADEIRAALDAEKRRKARDAEEAAGGIVSEAEIVPRKGRPPKKETP